MAASMPTTPRIFFTYVEPFFLFFGGALGPVMNSQSIISLLPAHLALRGTNSPIPTPLEHLLGLQSAVLMFMIAMVNVVIMLYATDRKVVRGYIAASAITDIPRWGAFLHVLGKRGIGQWRTWPQPLWLQLLVPFFTMSFKLFYLWGLFGQDRASGHEVVRGRDGTKKEL